MKYNPNINTVLVYTQNCLALIVSDHWFVKFISSVNISQRNIFIKNSEIFSYFIRRRHSVLKSHEYYIRSEYWILETNLVIYRAICSQLLLDFLF